MYVCIMYVNTHTVCTYACISTYTYMSPHSLPTYLPTYLQTLASQLSSVTQVLSPPDTKQREAERNDFFRKVGR